MIQSRHLCHEGLVFERFILRRTGRAGHCGAVGFFFDPLHHRRTPRRIDDRQPGPPGLGRTVRRRHALAALRAAVPDRNRAIPLCLAGPFGADRAGDRRRPAVPVLRARRAAHRRLAALDVADLRHGVGLDFLGGAIDAPGVRRDGGGPGRSDLGGVSSAARVLARRSPAARMPSASFSVSARRCARRPIW